MIFHIHIFKILIIDELILSYFWFDELAYPYHIVVVLYKHIMLPRVEQLFLEVKRSIKFNLSSEITIPDMNMVHETNSEVYC